MCLIIAKPRGRALPDDAIVTRAFTANSDGFGLAYSHKGDASVTIVKGAMTLPEAQEMIQAIPNPVSASVLLHFRIATQGKVSPGNCHPYPLSRKRSKLQALRLATPVAIAHNGIIPISSQGVWQTGEGLLSELTDTQLFIRYFLVGLGQALFNNSVLHLLAHASSGRFAILTPNGIIRLGDWQEDKGLYFSNHSWKVPTVSYFVSSGMIIWDNCSLCGEYDSLREILPSIALCSHCAKALHLNLAPFGIYFNAYTPGSTMAYWQKQLQHNNFD